MTDALDILINDTHVGVLTLLPDGRMLFSLNQSYTSNSTRPILSQSYFAADGQLLSPAKIYTGKAPPFFSNLLPEGQLRTYLAKRGGIKPTHEFHLLRLLGEDLPGAVFARSVDGFSLPSKNDDNDLKEEGLNQPLRFSLAGVQLKFSALMERNGGLTIPATGMGGNWIVKLPSPTHDNVPENEYAMMHMAAEIGILVPEMTLIPLSRIAGLPDFGKLRGNQAFAVKRFDRAEGGTRIHIEDFAQVYSMFPDKKYEGVSFTNIAGMIWTLTGEPGLQDFIRRLAYTIITGNGDMHLKNWSFIYRDGRTPELSPSYDLVSTVPYIPNDKLALKFLNTKNMMKIDVHLFEKLAEKAGLPKKLVVDTARETTDKTCEVWTTNKNHYALPTDMTKIIDRHMKALPLYKSA